MESQKCPACGAPVSPDAAFCAYCGAPVAVSAPAGAPMPTGPSPPYGGTAGFPAAPYAPGPTPPPRRRHTRLLLVVVIVVVVLIVGSVVAYEYLAPTAPSIQVQYIDIWAPDNVCGLNTNPIGYYGYNSSTNAAVPVELEVPNFNSSTCTVVSVTTNSTGFSLSGIQVPLAIVGNGNGTMNLTITSPGSSFSGTVNLVFA